MWLGHCGRQMPMWRSSKERGNGHENPDKMKKERGKKLKHPYRLCKCQRNLFKILIILEKNSARSGAF